MARRTAPPEPKREQLSETLERSPMSDGFHSHCYAFTGDFLLTCPKCNTPARIEAVGSGMDLSCGCRWHPPSYTRPTKPTAWVHFEVPATGENHA